MATMKTRAKFVPDFNSKVLLRNYGGADITSTAASAVLSLDKLTQAYWDNGELPFDKDGDGLGVAMHVTKVDRTTGDETYVVTVEVADDAAFTTNVVAVATEPSLTKTGSYYFWIDPDTIRTFSTNGAYIRLNATLGGTTPILNYAAWLVSGD